MAKNKNLIKAHKGTILKSAFFVVLVALIAVTAVAFYIYKNEQIGANVYVNNTNLGGLNRSEAKEKLASETFEPLAIAVNTKDNKKTYSLNPQTIELKVNSTETAQKAYEAGKNNKKVVKLSLSLSVNEASLDSFVKTIESEVSKEGELPEFFLKNGEIQIKKGIPGEELPADQIKEAITSAFGRKVTSLTLSTKETFPPLTDEQVKLALASAKSVENKKINLTLDGANVQTLKIDKLLAFISPLGGLNGTTINSFTNSLADQYNKEAVEPVFKFNESRVEEFSPGEKSVEININEFSGSLLTAISNLQTTEEKELSIEIPHTGSFPKSNIADVNNLGIQELIGRGTSRFTGSIPSRIHNVNLASSRINGVLVPPGETFSFAKAIGDISKYTGYQEAYVIQNGKTILGDGGGVCQVSTTLFRAVMNAGLPIVERHEHAYRVGYYEQDSGPGLDATVYVPSVDFKFKNDTANYILIQTKIDTKKLTAEFSIYGTKDGRVATVTKPAVTNQVPPPDDLYVDDPTLPVGKINQVEHKAWGAKVSFNYLVIKDGQTLFQKTFVSTYRPWGAVFMRGTLPV